MTDTAHKPVHTLTAGDLIDRNLVVIPRQTLMRAALHHIRQREAGEAAVVDESGRYIGMLSPADVFRWAAAGCPEAVVGPVLTCPYQVRGRLLSGQEGVICTLADGSCPYQAAKSTTAGRHTDVCERPETESPPFGVLKGYVTTDIIPVRPQLPLPELVRQIIDTRADRLVIVDESDRPVGFVSAAAVLNAISDGAVHGGSTVDSSAPSS